MDSHHVFESSRKPDRDAIAASLRCLREHARLTLSDVADAIGAAPTPINRFERGEPTLGKDKIAQLPALFGCKSLQDMVNKANALPPEPDRDAIAASLRCLREHARLRQSDVADAIGAAPAAISQFEHGKPALGKDKIVQLPALFGCKSLQHMVNKANALPAEPDGDAIAASLRCLREHARLTLSDVADAIGAAPAAISRFEHGGAKLGKDKIAQLPALFGCKSLQDMVNKANALPPEPDRDAIAASLRYLREHARLRQSDVADAIGVAPAAISQFEHGKPALGKDKIAQLPALFGCKSLQDMVNKTRESVTTQYSHRDAVRSAC